MMTLRHKASGAVQLVATADGYSLDDWEILNVAPPTEEQLATGRMGFYNGAWQLRPPAEQPPFSPVQLLSLLTIEEQERLFTSTNWEVNRLLWLTARLGSAQIGSQEHAGGMAVLRLGGVFLTDARRDRATAGLPPE